MEYGSVGDANRDNHVTFPDFLILAESFGRSDAPSWNDGDFDGSRVVDFLDFVALANNFEPTAVAIPEPSAIMIAFALLGCLRVQDPYGTETRRWLERRLHLIHHKQEGNSTSGQAFPADDQRHVESMFTRRPSPREACCMRF